MCDLTFILCAYQKGHLLVLVIWKQSYNKLTNVMLKNIMMLFLRIRKKVVGCTYPLSSKICNLLNLYEPHCRTQVTKCWLQSRTMPDLTQIRAGISRLEDKLYLGRGQLRTSISRSPPSYVGHVISSSQDS